MLIFTACNFLKKFLNYKMKRFFVLLCRSFDKVAVNFTSDNFKTNLKRSEIKEFLDNVNFSVFSSTFKNISSESNSNTLLYIERCFGSSCYGNLISYLSSNNGYVLFKNRIDYAKFHDYIAISENKILIDKVNHVPSIDPDLDDMIYSEADSYSDQLLSFVKDELFQLKYFREFSENIKNIRVSISDRFVPWIRSYCYISSFIDSHKIDKFYSYGINSPTMELICHNISSNKNIDVFIVSDKVKFDVNLLKIINRGLRKPQISIVTKFFDDKKINKNGKYIYFFANLRDPQYLETSIPVLEDLSRFDDFEINAISPYPVEGEINELKVNFFEPIVCKDTYPSFDEFVNCLDNAFDNFILSGFRSGSKEGLFRTFVCLNSKGGIAKVLRDCFVLKLQIDDVLKKSKILALVSLPGRLWFSQFLVGYLKDVPSIEIQSGTLSKTKRYKTPNSEKILAVDDFSKSVYVDYLGVSSENVDIVGSPRSDVKLSSIRSFTKENSRSYVFNENSKLKILCLATQPYGLEIMTNMVKIANSFVESQEDWVLLVSMHPNESSIFENSYKFVLNESLLKGRAKISYGNIYHNLNASDHVVTYFSTAGLEAFSLGKLVSTYRPEGTSPVPFDLCELGVAKSFTTTEDLRKIISADTRETDLTEGLRRLKDGKSVERITNHILKALMLHFEKCINSK
jgi:hypothetical protein